MDLRRTDGNILRIGHRGAPALAPENTLESFERAVELGVDLVEFDVVARENGTLALAHSADVLSPDSPTLDDALSFFERVPEIGLHVDLKLTDGEKRLVDALRRRGLLGRTFVSSFSPSSLRMVAAAAPGVPLGLCYPENARQFLRGWWALSWRIVDWLDRVGASAAVLHHRVVSRRLVERCHGHDAAVIAWPVDDARTVRQLVRMGVDGVVTNDPRVLTATLPA